MDSSFAFTYGIPHRAPDKLLQSLSKLTVHDLQHRLISRSSLLACLPDNGSGNVDRNLPDLSEIGKQRCVGIVQGGCQVGQGLDTGHKHARRDRSRSGEDCSETETRVDLKASEGKVSTLVSEWITRNEAHQGVIVLGGNVYRTHEF